MRYKYGEVLLAFFLLYTICKLYHNHYQCTVLISASTYKGTFQKDARFDAQPSKRVKLALQASSALEIKTSD